MALTLSHVNAVFGIGGMVGVAAYVVRIYIYICFSRIRTSGRQTKYGMRMSVLMRCDWIASVYGGLASEYTSGEGCKMI